MVKPEAGHCLFSQWSLACVVVVIIACSEPRNPKPGQPQRANGPGVTTNHCEHRNVSRVCLQEVSLLCVLLWMDTWHAHWLLFQCLFPKLHYKRLPVGVTNRR